MSDEEKPAKKSKMASEVTTQPEVTKAEYEKICAHWVKRKKRYCKIQVVKGKDYCAEHAVDIEVDSDRIPCPLDNRHTVYKNKLNKHLKICNSRVVTTGLPEYIHKNVNLGNDKEDQMQADLKTIKLKELEDNEFYQVIDKVKELHKKYIENEIGKLEYHHKCMDDLLDKKEYGKEHRKHLLQLASLLGILESEGKIDDSICFLEFGAGKGQFAVSLAKLLETKRNSQVILVDRMALRHKKDNKIEDRCLVQRIKADIADFSIDKFNTLKSFQHCVAVSKHLCGGATDLTLRCIAQATENLTDLILIALCCHHRCDWLSFVGKDFLKKQQISQREFVIITKMVGWAVCGTGMSRERRKALKEQELTQQEITAINENQRLTLSERETIGVMCKRILDYARLEYLQNNGYEAKLHYYVPKEVTLENVVLLAKRRGIRSCPSEK